MNHKLILKVTTFQRFTLVPNVLAQWGKPPGGGGWIPPSILFGVKFHYGERKSLQRKRGICRQNQTTMTFVTLKKNASVMFDSMNESILKGNELIHKHFTNRFFLPRRRPDYQKTKHFRLRHL